MMRLLLFGLLIASSPVWAALKIATTTTDLAALAEVVAGEGARVFSVSKGTQDPHQIEAKPSFMVRLRDVDLVLAHGLELESAWLGPLLRGARNPKILPGTSGYLELGPLLEPLEVARGTVSRGEGDVHPLGNPHFHLDPVRMGLAAERLAERLASLDAAGAEDYRTRAKSFKERLELRTRSWRERVEKSGVKEFVSYHKSFSYFAARFGLENRLQLEPKPGIPPTASHILHVVREMKSRGVKLVLVENFFDDSARAKIMQEVPGARVVKVPIYVQGEPGVKSSEDLIEAIVRAVEGK